MRESGKFIHINAEFDCEYCGFQVKPLKSGCRNHCPICLSSKHVDINPGDRACLCHGRLRAVSYETCGKKGVVLTFRCETCGKSGRNKAALYDPVQPDNYEAILTLNGASL